MRRTGSGGYALASSSGGTITVGVSHKRGTLYKAKKCAKGDKKLSWNKVGPQAPQGSSGATGPQGPAGPGTVLLRRCQAAPLRPFCTGAASQQ